ncbi:MAG: CvpA family protein [Clostridia bacterium]|nr:CvpA family protein [Clostridia bacterium]
MNTVIIVFAVVLLGVFVLTVILSAKRGFVCSLIETIGFLAALILSITLSTPIAEIIYDRAIAPTVVSAVDSAVADNTQNTVDSVWTALPGFVTGYAEKVGVSKEHIASRIGTASEHVSNNMVESASQNVIRPMMVSLLKIMVSVVLFTVLFFVVKIAARLLNKVFSFSVAGKVNTILGGVLGVIKGLIFVFFGVMIFRLVCSYLPNGADILSAENWQWGSIADMGSFLSSKVRK